MRRGGEDSPLLAENAEMNEICLSEFVRTMVPKFYTLPQFEASLRGHHPSARSLANEPITGRGLKAISYLKCRQQEIPVTITGRVASRQTEGAGLLRTDANRGIVQAKYASQGRIYRSSNQRPENVKYPFILRIYALV